MIKKWLAEGFIRNEDLIIKEEIELRVFNNYYSSILIITSILQIIWQ